MEKSILIAIDGSFCSRKAMEYVAGMRLIVKNLHYTLINIQPKISDFILEDAKKTPRAKAALKKVTQKNQENSDRLLYESKNKIVGFGVDENRIKTVSKQQTMGIAKSILDYGKESLFDAIVLGKRGLSRLAETFIGSTTNSVLEHTGTIPVWSVAGEVKPSKILLAIDGSESALRTVDHVSFIMRDNPDSNITLLHITPRLRDYCSIEFDKKDEDISNLIYSGDKECIDSFYTHAANKFKDAGLKESQIKIKEVKSKLNIGKIIIKEAAKDGFSTLVIGRRGINRSFFMGSVSRYVLNNAKDCAVWLVP